MPFTENQFILKNTNRKIVESIENNARSNIELTLNGVFDFINNHNKIYNPQYKVFNEQFVLCWAGEKKVINKKSIILKWKSFKFKKFLLCKII